VPAQHQQELLDMLNAAAAAVEDVEAGGSSSTVIAQVEPGVFRDLHTFMQDTTLRQGRVEVLSFVVTAADAAAGSVEDFNTLPSAAAASGPAGAGPGSLADQQQQQWDAAASPASAAAAAAPSGRLHHPSRHRPLGAAAAAVAAGAGSSGGGSSNGGSSSSGGKVLYARGPIAGLPEEYASRRERFAELDTLQPGWLVELRSRGDSVDAVFFSPRAAGTLVGTYATARRQALAASKAVAGAAQ
jgi:hypothetical protein